MASSLSITGVMYIEQLTLNTLLFQFFLEKLIAVCPHCVLALKKSREIGTKEGESGREPQNIALVVVCYVRT